MAEKPEPIPLVNKARPDADPIAYACGECGLVFRPTEKELARQHCQPRVCECGAECDQKFYIYCWACRSKRAREKQERLAEKALKVSYIDYEEPIFVEDEEGHPVGHQEGFFMSVDEAVEYLSEEDADSLPDKIFVWGSVSVPFEADASWIVESMLEEHYEDAGDNISNADIKELQKLLDGWCEKQKVESYTQTHGVLVTGIEEQVAMSRKAGEMEDRGELKTFLNRS